MSCIVRAASNRLDLVRRLPSAALLCLAIGAVHGAAAAEPIEEIVVRGQSSLAPEFARVGNLSVIDEDVLDGIGLVHPTEAFVRVPGVWISRGSGQEHLTAIRSPVLNGPGACGAFLFLENGVPLRPAGFCNVNNLFEVNIEQASAVEVTRGPAGAVYGGNALLGAINVVAPRVDDRPPSLMLEVGPWDFRRLDVEGGVATERGGVRAAFTGIDTNGWAEGTGYQQEKLSLVWDTAFGDWTASTLLSATSLDQDTGGFVIGDDAYQDSELRDSNPNPEAYREAWAVRLSSELVRPLEAGSLVVTPYLRASDMDFLQHFLPGQPLEENGQSSGGAILRWRNSGERLDWTLGGQLEYADTWLRQTQDGPTVGSPFLVATRPPGTHYDYEVQSLLAAAFYDLAWHLAPRVDLVHSLRVETLDYRYDNEALDGNTQDDGTPCGFGGCLYTRPADRDDTFTDVASRVGIEFRPDERARFWASAGVGFRAPQSTELYRLQSGQTVADLNSESVRALEVGIEAGDEKGSVSL
ncbi:MAG: TonB-dependent receptor, partial [Pseudomonadales bacterium]|nr:TonB-dependent receptor [Pseudomonadales bacterium]